MYWRSDAENGGADEQRRDPAAWRWPPPGDPCRRRMTRLAVQPWCDGTQRRDCQRHRRPPLGWDEHVAGGRYVGTGVHTPNIGARMVRSVTSRRAMLHPGATPESAGRGHGRRAEQAEQSDECRRANHSPLLQCSRHKGPWKSTTNAFPRLGRATHHRASPPWWPWSLQFGRAMRSVERPSGARHDVRQRVHVRPTRVEVHDAGPKQIAVIDHRVRHERLS